METIFDILTVIIFAGLVVLFLQRSVSEEPAGDAMWQYLVASVGCATANYLGNNSYPMPALFVMFGTLVFIYYVLRPFTKLPRP
jgi:hypothetical protein